MSQAGWASLFISTSSTSLCVQARLGKGQKYGKYIFEPKLGRNLSKLNSKLSFFWWKDWKMNTSSLSFKSKCNLRNSQENLWTLKTRKYFTSDGVQLVGGGGDPLVQRLHVAGGLAKVEVSQRPRHPEMVINKSKWINNKRLNQIYSCGNFSPTLKTWKMSFKFSLLSLRHSGVTLSDTISCRDRTRPLLSGCNFTMDSSSIIIALYCTLYRALHQHCTVHPWSGSNKHKCDDVLFAVIQFLTHSMIANQSGRAGRFKDESATQCLTLSVS